MIIDAHIHLGSFSVAYPFAESRTEKVIQMLKNEEVDYALTSSAKALHHDCSQGNKEVLEASKKYKQIIPYVVVNPWHREHALKELEQCLQNGYVGVKLHPNCHNYPLDSRLAEPVLELCQEQKIPILTHSEGDCRLSGAGAIRAVAQKFPDLTLIAGHGGIFSDREVAQVVADYRQLYLEISVEYEAGKLEKTIEMVGPDRMMFGSDCPLHHPSVMLQRLRVAKLTKEEEEQILWKTAQKVFSLELPD